MTDLQANADRFEGLARVYDASRPTPPLAVVELLCRYARTPRPELVVDLGCGTGLASRVWAGRAEQIIGIDPNDDMRQQAVAAMDNLPEKNAFSFRKGYSDATGLMSECADIVTCSQCLHWMDPHPTFAEVARILRPGGVFAAIDADMVPAFGGPAEEAFLMLRRRVRSLEEKLQLTPIKRWDKDGHLGRMAASGQFRFTRQVLAHDVESGNGSRLVGLALSLGGVATLLAHGVEESAFGLDVLRREASAMGDGRVPFHWGYTVRLGLK